MLCRYEVGKGRSIKVAFSENLAIPQYYANTGRMVMKSYTVILKPSTVNGLSTRLAFEASCIGHELVWLLENFQFTALTAAQMLRYFIMESQKATEVDGLTDPTRKRLGIGTQPSSERQILIFRNSSFCTRVQTLSLAVTNVTIYFLEVTGSLHYF